MMVLDNEHTIWCPLCRGRGTTKVSAPCVGCGGSGVIAQVKHDPEPSC